MEKPQRFPSISWRGQRPSVSSPRGLEEREGSCGELLLLQPDGEVHDANALHRRRNRASSDSMYPTLMEDSNGNQIVLRYEPGQGVTWRDSSARIWQI